MTAPTDRAALEEAIGILRRWWCHGMAERFDALDKIYINRVCEAAEAHLATLPRTKMTEVWHIEWALGSCPMVQMYTSRADAERAARWLAEEPHRACIRVTGPHLHEVPA